MDILKPFLYFFKKNTEKDYDEQNKLFRQISPPKGGLKFDSDFWMYLNNRPIITDEQVTKLEDQISFALKYRTFNKQSVLYYLFVKRGLKPKKNK